MAGYLGYDPCSLGVLLGALEAVRVERIGPAGPRRAGTAARQAEDALAVHRRCVASLVAFAEPIGAILRGDPLGRFRPLALDVEDLDLWALHRSGRWSTVTDLTAGGQHWRADLEVRNARLLAVTLTPRRLERAAARRRPRGGATGAVPRAARRAPGGPRRVPRRAGPEWPRSPDRPGRPHLRRAPPGGPGRAPGSRPIRRGDRRPRRRVGGQPGGRAPPRRGVGRRGPGRRAVRRGPRVARGGADARGADHRRTGPLGNRLVATPLQRTGPTWPPLARGGRRRDPGRAHHRRTGGSGLPAGAGPRTRPAASHHPSAQRRLDAYGQRSAPDRIHQPGSDGQRSRSRRGSPLDAGRARRPRPSARRARRLLPFRPDAAPRAGAARPSRPLRRAPAPPPGRPLRRHRSGSLPYRVGRVGWVGPAPDRGRSCRGWSPTNRWRCSCRRPRGPGRSTGSPAPTSPRPARPARSRPKRTSSAP